MRARSRGKEVPVLPSLFPHFPSPYLSLSLLPCPFLWLFLLSLPLEVGPLESIQEVWESAVSSLGGVWDGATAEIYVI